MKKTIIYGVLLTIILSLTMPQNANARNQIRMAGSSTVFPFATIAVEQFAKRFPTYKTPIVESGGSSGGLKVFCQGVGKKTIDIANSSRPIKDSELRVCAQNGVDRIIEVMFGFDGIVFASSIDSPKYQLTLENIYKSLAEKVPIKGKLVDNPYYMWKQIDPSYPDARILYFIPGEKHGTRDVFENNALYNGCKNISNIEPNLSAKALKKSCIRVRKDGVSSDIDGDYTVTLTRIRQERGSIGVFGFSFYDMNRDKIRLASVNGMLPDIENISDGTWPLARPLFIYVKEAHLDLIPGLKKFVDFFVSDEVIGEDGITVDFGLIPLPEELLEETRRKLRQKIVMAIPEE